jgi:hypothetical protein
MITVRSPLRTLEKLEQDLLRYQTRQASDATRWLRAALSPECQSLLYHREQRDALARRVSTSHSLKNHPELEFFDVRLARWGILRGWSNDEIAELLTHHHQVQHEEKQRQREGRPRAFLRPHMSPSWPRYCERIISRATATARTEVFTSVSQLLGVSVARFVKGEATPPFYVLVSTGGEEVLLGSAQDVLSPTVCRARIYEAMGKVVPPITKEAWADTVRKLSRYQEHRPVADSVTARNVVKWVRSYCAARPPTKEQKLAVERGRAFVRGKQVFFRLGALRRFVWQTLGIAVDDSQLRHRLRCLGFRGRRITSRTAAGRKCRFYWEGPLSLTIRVLPSV